RARFHVHGARVGFYREGTHQLCDATATRQLRPEAIQAVTALAAALEPEVAVTSIAIAENIAGDQRAAHVELGELGFDQGQTGGKRGPHQGQTRVRPGSDPFRRAFEGANLRGLSARNSSTGELLTFAEPIVLEPLDTLTNGRVADGRLQRHAESFFQGNR